MRAANITSETGTLNPDPWHRHSKGAGVHRLDHALIAAEDPELVERFFMECFDFRTSERLITDSAEPDNQDEELRQDEERRLLYVGLTRAARALFLSHCEQRSLYGRTLRLPPSPFMTQIREFCRHSSLAAHTRKEHKQISLF